MHWRIPTKLALRSTTGEIEMIWRRTITGIAETATRQERLALLSQPNAAPVVANPHQVCIAAQTTAQPLTEERASYAGPQPARRWHTKEFGSLFQDF